MKKVLILGWMLVAWLVGAAQTAGVESPDKVKLEQWTRKLFVGGQLAANLSFADNITDHPTFRHFTDAVNLGGDVYVGTFVSRNVGFRAGLGYHSVQNRMDNEWVSAPQFKHFYKGNGYYQFGVMKLYADALFDISGVSYTEKFYPFHVCAVLGVGMLSAGKKTMEKTGATDFGEYTPFEKIIDTRAGTYLAVRFGLLFDYRVSRHLSANLELGVNATNDKFEGIKYAEPVDFMIQLSAGVSYYF